MDAFVTTVVWRRNAIGKCTLRVESVETSSDAQGVRPKRAVIVPGKLDALHLGHQALVRQACKLGDRVFILTFPGMAEVLGWEPAKPICSRTQRLAVFAEWSAAYGASVVGHEIPFAGVRRLPPSEFVLKLAEDFESPAIVCGEDWRFGFKAAGNANTLRDICRENALVAEVVGKIYVDGVRASSTRVRGALSEGDIGLAARLLGRPHQVRGTYDPARRVLSAVENICPGAGTYRVLARSTEGTTLGTLTVEIACRDGDEPTVTVLEDRGASGLAAGPLQLEFAAATSGPP